MDDAPVHDDSSVDAPQDAGPSRTTDRWDVAVILLVLLVVAVLAVVALVYIDDELKIILDPSNMSRSI